MRAAAFLFLFTLACPAMAATSDCLKVEPDLDRLACYDKESGRTQKQETLPSAHANWQVSQETSAMTDTTTVALTTTSAEIINCGWNGGANIGLVIRCQESVTSLYFATGCQMTSSQYNNYGDIEYRIDAQKARKVRGDESTDSKALGLWSGAKAIPVIKQLLGRSKLIVRMMPFSESPFTATFDISGIDDVIAPLRKACRW